MTFIYMRCVTHIERKCGNPGNFSSIGDAIFFVEKICRNN